MRSFLARWPARARQAWADGRLVFWLIVLCAAAWEVQALFLVSAPVRAVGAKPYEVESFGAGVPVGQTFRMHHDGLDSVRVQFSAESPARIEIRCKLLTWGGGGGADPWVAFYQWTAPLDLPQGHSWQRFRFTPVAASDDVVYQFQVQRIDPAAALSAEDPSLPRIGLVGSLDDSQKEGNLIDGTTQVIDRDLFFEARADDSGFSTFRRNTNDHLPERLRSKTLQLAMLLLYNLALAVFLRALIVDAPNHHSPAAQTMAAPAASGSGASRAQRD